MAEPTRPDMQLMSMSDVIREYRYPKEQLAADLDSGNLAHFQTTRYGRFYIPRKAVEDRIAELSAKKTGKGMR